MSVGSIGRGNFVKHLLVGLANKIGVAIDSPNLHADRLEIFPVGRTINNVTLDGTRCDGIPTKINVALVPFGADISRGLKRLAGCGAFRQLQGRVQLARR